MIEPIALTKAIDSATKVANTPLFTTIIDKILGLKISHWAAQGEVIKRIYIDGYEKAQQQGMPMVQYIASVRHTINLLNTAVKSAKHIDPNKPNDIQMDNDFFWNTLEHAKTISNEQVQELIAKIIAGEYNQPSSYSMSTLHTLKMLGKEELELFERVGSLIVRVGSLIPSSIIIPKDAFMLDKMQDIRKEMKIDFASFQSLQQLGLFLPNEMVQNMDNPSARVPVLNYFNQTIVFEPTHTSNVPVQLPVYYALSNTGKQIIKHLNPQFNQKYFEWLQKNYHIKNFQMQQIVDINK